MIVQSSRSSIQRAGKIIQQGGLVAFPTETVYGLGADALNSEAVAQIFAAKGRPAFDPLIVHIADKAWLEKLVKTVDAKALKLIDSFWPGPLTLVFERQDIVPDVVTSGLETVAIRMPSHPVALDLLRAANTPIAAPSANLFGQLSPTQALHVEKQLGSKLDMILDAGPCSVGLESTILSVSANPAVLMRPGGLKVEDIERLIGPVSRKPAAEKIQVPGQLPSHYAPKTPLKIVDSVSEVQGGSKVGVLLFKPAPLNFEEAMVEVLSDQGDMNEAAVNLFAALHRLDEADLEVIYAERVLETGLGLAIADRMQRASWNTQYGGASH